MLINERMFIAFISTIMESFATIFWKKSIWYWVGVQLHDLIWYTIGWLVVFYFLFAWINFSEIDNTLITGTFFLIISYMLVTKLSHMIYKKEKLSMVMPYTNISKILTIIIWFFIFSDVSLISLFITIVAIIFIILFSIDYKTFKLPNNITLIIFNEIIIAGCTIGTGLLLLNHSETLHFLLYIIIWLLLLSIIILFTSQLKTLKWVPKQFYINNILGWMGWISWFLSLVVIKKLWVSITILLSFIWIWITLLLGYFLLNDKPSKKDILLTIIVSILVWLGYFYK